MSLEGTLFVTGSSLVGGWMLKVLSDRISTWQAEKKLVNSIIYHLYDLGRHADRIIGNYSTYHLFSQYDDEEDKDAYRFLLSSNRAVDSKEVVNRLRSSLLALAEIDPVFAMELNSFVTSMEMIFGLTHLDFSDDEGKKFDEEILSSLRGIRDRLSDKVKQLLPMRHFLRKKRSARAFIEAGLRDESVEEMFKDIRV